MKGGGVESRIGEIGSVGASTEECWRSWVMTIHEEHKVDRSYFFQFFFRLQKPWDLRWKCWHKGSEVLQNRQRPPDINQTTPHTPPQPAPYFITSPLQQVLLPRLLRQHIKRRLRTKPTRHLSPDSLIRKRRLLLSNLDGLASPAAGGRIRH